VFMSDLGLASRFYSGGTHYTYTTLIIVGRHGMVSLTTRPCNYSGVFGQRICHLQVSEDISEFQHPGDANWLVCAERL